MPTSKLRLQPAVTTFLDELKHPARAGIDLLRNYILSAHAALEESVKWNAPNYSVEGKDCITMKILPPSKTLLVVLHAGAGKKAPLKQKFIKNESPLLSWRGNDRAIITFKDAADIEKSKSEFTSIVKAWTNASM